MRHLFFAAFLSSLALPAHAEQSPDSYQAAIRLINAGAPRLALERVERDQPPQQDKEQWADWEALRLSLLLQLDRPRDILARLEKLPADAPAHLARQAHLAGARAALKTAQPVLARIYLARLLWRSGVSDNDYRQARQLVIETYLAENRPKDAYPAMLRYEQDFQPLAKEQALRFVEALAANGMEKEAVNWLPHLAENNPLKLLIRVKAGLIAPEAAITQARLALQKNPGLLQWAVVAHAAMMQQNLALRLEALEQMLNLQGDSEDSGFAVKTRELWREYQAYAEALANRHQLLVGDDPAWLDLALRLQASSPPQARALFAYLASNAKSSELRQSTQLQLAASLQRQKLGAVAARLFADASRLPGGTLADPVRHALGAGAADAGRYKLAAKYWQGLRAPQGSNPEEWQLKLAWVLVRAGMPEDAGAVLRQLLSGKKSVTGGVGQRFLDLAQEMLDANRPGVAEQLLGALLPAVEPVQKREVLFRLGKAAELRGDYKLAADYFLQSALLIEGKSQDSLAQTARLRSAANLTKAGFKEDAKAQYQWLLKVVKDKAQIEAIQRELKKL